MTKTFEIRINVKGAGNHSFNDDLPLGCLATVKVDIPLDKIEEDALRVAASLVDVAEDFLKQTVEWEIISDI